MTKLKNPEFECLFARLTCLVMGFVTAMAFVFCSAAYAQLTNEESVKEGSRHSDDKGIPSSPMGLILGLRAGTAFPTEKVLKEYRQRHERGPTGQCRGALCPPRMGTRGYDARMAPAQYQLMGAEVGHVERLFHTADGRIPPKPQHERIFRMG